MQSTTLGGFKVLKDVVRFSLVLPSGRMPTPGALCRAISEDRINLPYLTCIRDGFLWRLTLAVDAASPSRTAQIIECQFGGRFLAQGESVILSIFPHRNDPAITGSLLEVLGQEGLEADAMANSPSAISVVLKGDSLNRASDALFATFSFSAYRTPQDWKLAQRGKERLYKEVVASYQEKRPKVYGLNYRESQHFLSIKLNKRDIAPFGSVLKAIARLGLDLPFLSTAPCDEPDEDNVYLCLPEAGIHKYRDMILQAAPGIRMEDMSSAGTFSMTGPHFGDRYGIASELLGCFEDRGVGILGLNCTVASVRGVVPQGQIHTALEAIKTCFDVPAITKKD